MPIHFDSCFVSLVAIEMEFITILFRAHVSVNTRVPGPQEGLQEPLVD